MNDSIFELIDKTAQVPENALIFNHASQIWNNDFFFQTLVKLNYLIFFLKFEMIG
jgi:hypothetical protein